MSRPPILVLVMAAAFGGGGWFPFPVSTFVSVLIFCGLGLVLVPHPSRTLRLALLLYGVSAVVIFVVQNPVGGNVARLGVSHDGKYMLFDQANAHTLNAQRPPGDALSIEHGRRALGIAY